MDVRVRVRIRVRVRVRVRARARVRTRVRVRVRVRVATLASARRSLSERSPCVSHVRLRPPDSKMKSLTAVASSSLIGPA